MNEVYKTIAINSIMIEAYNNTDSMLEAIKYTNERMSGVSQEVLMALWVSTNYHLHGTGGDYTEALLKGANALLNGGNINKDTYEDITK